jgi:phosphoglycerol transferase MdoB-like AlkP superfamily enzyme
MAIIKLILKSFFKQILFWLVVFTISRIFFLIYYASLLKGISFLSILSTFYYALNLDISACGYIMVIPFFLLVVQTFYNPKWLNKLNLAYVFIALLIYFFITTAEIGVYGEWKTKLYFKALNYLENPAEITNTAGTSTVIIISLIFFVQLIGSFWLYRKWFYTKIENLRRNIVFSFLFFIIAGSAMFLGIRGGTQQIPINQSQSYFSKHDILNITAVNSAWNMMHSILNNYENLNSNPFKVYDDAQAKLTVESMYKVSKDTCPEILTTKRPNIVVFILEGWSADLIESLGGDAGITPNFRELEKEGILFTNFYSSGERSQQGMATIFSGYPAFPIANVVNQPEKYGKLPYIGKMLQNEGYKTSYYFGGQLIYGNMKGYIFDAGFDKIVEGKDFPGNLPRGKLGIQDEYTFPYFLSQINSEEQPFMSALFTMSTHSPYDIGVPMKKMYDTENEYVNSAVYSDKCFGRFFAEARKQSWYKNTLFIFISDHSHESYRNHDFYEPANKKIVFMLFGDIIKKEYQGIKISKIGSQTDIAATLLPQLGLKADKFKWSKNILNPYSGEFAYYSFEEGVGWIRPGGYFTYHYPLKRFFQLNISDSTTINKDSLIREGKSYLQEVFRDYLDK